MAISITWATKVINIPQADLILVSGDVYKLDLNAFRLELKSLEASEEGIPELDTHSHNTQVTVSGVTLGRVVEIINGYTITFEDGQYAVNLEGANSNIGDATVLNLNQVSVRSFNSAGLVNIVQLDTMAYQGAVWIDVDNGVTGITKGVLGLPHTPVNNLSDALNIASQVNLKKLVVLNGAITLTSSMLDWFFELRHGTSLDFGGQNVDGSEAVGGRVTGIATGSFAITFSEIVNVDGLQFLAANSILSGTQRLGLGHNQFSNCTSGIPGVNTPIIDWVGSNRSMSLRAYSGGQKIINSTDATNVASLEFLAGQLILDSTCVSGTFVARGNAKVTNNSDAIFINELINSGTIGEAVWDVDANNFNVLDTTGYVLNSISSSLSDGVSISSSSVINLVDSIWNEPNGSHLISGSTGDSIYSGSSVVDVSASVDVSSIVSGVWDAGASGFNTSGSIGYLQNRIANIDANVLSIGGTVNLISGAVDFIKDIEGGRWRIDSGLNQMVFYKDDNTTEIARFDLFDAGGAPTTDAVFDRRKV